MVVSVATIVISGAIVNHIPSDGVVETKEAKMYGPVFRNDETFVRKMRSVSDRPVTDW